MKRILLGALASSLLVLAPACGEATVNLPTAPKPATPDPLVEAPAEAPAETRTEEETPGTPTEPVVPGEGEPTNPPEPAAPRCPSLMGSTRVGARWTFHRETYEGELATEPVHRRLDVVITSANVVGDALEVLRETRSQIVPPSDPDGVVTITLDRIRCSVVGAVLVSSVRSGDFGSGRTTYEPPIRFLVADGDAATGWRQSGEAIVDNPESPETPAVITPYERSFQYLRVERIPTRAGTTFDALVFQETSGSVALNSYYAQGAGLVQVSKERSTDYLTALEP